MALWGSKLKRPRIATVFILIVMIAVLGIWLIVRTATQSSRIKESAWPINPNSISARRAAESAMKNFYQLWAPSRHGLAMQPFSAELARTQLSPQESDIEIGDYRYRAEFETGGGVVRERGPEGENEYRIEYALGGKNVYFFLTPMERGRLQVLPVAYDAHEKTWYDTTAGMVRHAAIIETKASELEGPAPDVQHILLQLPRQPALDELRPGIRHLSNDLGGTGNQLRNLSRRRRRTCSGVPGGPQGPYPRKITKIIGLKAFTHEQMNDLCASCHAKMTPLTATFRPGDRYFDHFTPGRLRKSGFLSGRARPRRELYLHPVADKPLCQVRPARLPALPHIRRTLPLQGKAAERRLSALSRGPCGERGGSLSPPGR